MRIDQTKIAPGHGFHIIIGVDLFQLLTQPIRFFLFQLNLLAQISALAFQLIQLPFSGNKAVKEVSANQDYNQ